MVEKHGVSKGISLVFPSSNPADIYFLLFLFSASQDCVSYEMELDQLWFVSKQIPPCILLYTTNEESPPVCRSCRVAAVNGYASQPERECQHWHMKFKSLHAREFTVAAYTSTYRWASRYGERIAILILYPKYTLSPV
jgi:hypothetical protein